MTRHACRAVALALTLAATWLQAQDQAASASAQLAYGARFNDAVYGLNTVDQRMSTIVLDATARSAIGENTFFVRFFSGRFVDAGGELIGQRTQMYGEWTSRLSLVRRARRGSSTVVLRDLFIAGQLNRGGGGFRANLIGAGMKLRWPGQLATTSTVYYRHAEGESHGIKARTSWFLPFHAGQLSMSLEGSADVVTNTRTGTDFSTMPALLVDGGKLLGMPRGRIAIGGEWFVHHTQGARLSAPQLIARWTF